MFNVPPPLFRRGGREVRPLNKETTVQVSDTTMMTKAKMFVTKKKIKF
jgi:hypothetical protein